MISDSRLDRYLRAANHRASTAFRPSTQKGHRYVLKLFIGFALALRPSVSLIMAFIEHLATTQKTGTAVLSTVNSLKAVLQRNYIPIMNFLDRSVELQLRAVKINKRTPALQRPPVRLRDLRIIISHLSHMEYSQHFRVAVLILFTTAFRRSNLAPASARAFDPTRHLVRADVQIAAAHVQVLQKWSKTQQQITRDRWLAVPHVSGSPLCLHAAISSMYRESPTIRGDQPLLTFDDGAAMLYLTSPRH